MNIDLARHGRAFSTRPIPRAPPSTLSDVLRDVNPYFGIDHRDFAATASQSPGARAWQNLPNVRERSLKQPRVMLVISMLQRTS
jgi:hypothetical protein